MKEEPNGRNAYYLGRQWLMFIHQDADTEWQILNRATDIGSWYGFVTEPIRVLYKSF